MAYEHLLPQLRQNRDEVQQRIAGLLAQGESRGGKLLASEDRELQKLIGQRAQFDEQIEDFEAKEAREENAARSRVALGLGDGPPGDGGRGHIYHRGGPYSWIKDLAFATIAGHPGQPAAEQRLQQHGHEIEVDARSAPGGTAARALAAAQGRNDGQWEDRTGLTTVAGAGGTFVPPIYLVDEFVPFARAGRPFADAITVQNLPPGTDSINVPKVATGTAVASQATQNTAVQETDLTDAYLTAPVVTIAGQQTVSLQLIEQSPIPFDEVVFGDLVSGLEAETDRQCINGSGSSGQMTGLLNIASFVTTTYTDATPTFPKLWSKLALAIETVHANRFLPPTHLFVTPLRWAWMLAAEDSNSRPLVVPTEQGPYNAFAVNERVEAQGRVGSTAGLPTFVDANIPSNLGAGTNQDPLIVLRAPDVTLYQGALNTRALPMTLGNQLSVLLQTYRYTALMANRYTSASTAVNGTGTIVPSL